MFYCIRLSDGRIFGESQAKNSAGRKCPALYPYVIVQLILLAASTTIFPG